MDDRQEVRSVKKALRALVTLNQRGETSVTDMAKCIGVPRPTAYRLLETLATEGYVERLDNSNLYSLTSRVKNLSSGFGDLDLALEVARPLLKDLGRALGWPITFATPAAHEMIVRITTDYDTTKAIDRFMVGYRVPIVHAPAGYCYLAYCDNDEREKVIDMAVQSRDPRQHLARNRDRLGELLARIRGEGYCAREYAAYKEGGLAVPILINGAPVGGIVMRYLKSAMQYGHLQSHYLPELQKLAARINTGFNEMARAS